MLRLNVSEFWHHFSWDTLHVLLYFFRLPYLTVEYSATIPVYISLLTIFVFINFGLSTFMDPGAYPKGKSLLHLQFV